MALTIAITIICIGGLRIMFDDMKWRQEQKRKQQHWQRTGQRLKIK